MSAMADEGRLPRPRDGGAYPDRGEPVGSEPVVVAMRFRETPLAGAYTVELEPHVDSRGYLARAFCRDEFREHGLAVTIAQANMSYNKARGTVRGMHYQVPPAAEAKLVRCVRGTVYDVIVDVRPDSPTFLQWFGVELSERNGVAMYVPEQFAHGFQALADGSVLFYHASEPYAPDRERGLRHDDPALGIAWPLETRVLSEKDASWPLLDESD